MSISQPQIWSGPLPVHFSTYLLVDPHEREERVMDGLLVIAMNKHREICTLQSSGGIMLLKEQVSANAGSLRMGLVLEAFSSLFNENPTRVFSVIVGCVSIWFQHCR